MVFKCNNFVIFPNAYDIISQNIKFLTINQCKLNTKSLKSIIDKIKNSTNPCLKYLNLADNGLAGQEISQFLN